MAFEIVEFDRTKEVDYVPRIWLCNLDEIDIGQKIKDKALVECSWPPGYIKTISRAKDMGMEPNEDWPKYPVRILGIAREIFFICLKWNKVRK